MGYIFKKTDSLVNVKLTDKGRSNLAEGKLTFSKFALGDGEIDYINKTPANINIFRPVDNNPEPIYLVPSEGNNIINNIHLLKSIPEVIANTADERGFFSGSTQNIFKSDLTKNFNYKVPTTSLTGGTTFTILTDIETIVTTETNPSGDLISSGDYLLLKLINPYFSDSFSRTQVDIKPFQYLWYEVMNVITGTTAHTVTVDRNVPNYNAYYVDLFGTGTTSGATSGITSGSTFSIAHIYPGGDLIADHYDNDSPLAYWSNGVLDFTSNNDNSLDDVPVWNMHILNIDNPIGLNALAFKSNEHSRSYNYKGFWTYLKYAEEHTNITKLGIIHYTNHAVSNYYGEGFYKNTLQLHFPTLMWHRKQFGAPGLGDEIGYTFVCSGTVKTIDGKIKYYDLIDQETTPITIGKVFPDFKIIVIEHEELLTALSLKSNRNYTLPKPRLTLVDAGVCPSSTAEGIIKYGDELHVSYLLYDRNTGIYPMHCGDYVSITVDKINDVKDVLFEFPKDNTDTTYNEFPYFKKIAQGGYGWYANEFLVLLQKTDVGERPNPTNWYYLNGTNYIGGDGCLNTSLDLSNEVELYSESFIVTDPNKITYDLAFTPLGEVLVALNGVTLKEAFNSDFIYSLSPTDPSYPAVANNLGDYLFNSINENIFFKITPAQKPIGFPNDTYLTIGDIIQVHYLKGKSTAGTTIKQDVITPAIIPTALSGELYENGGFIFMDLDEIPSGSVYVFYNGQVISTTNYTIVSGTPYKIRLGFVPATGSRLSLLYLTYGAGATGITANDFSVVELNGVKIYLNDQTFPVFATENYNLNDFINIPTSSELNYHSFGDETFFYGNLNTDIKATIYRTFITINVLPNRYIKSTNPTFDETKHKVAFSELVIYDDDNDVVGIGKFSEPLTRKYNSDVLIIQATIDF